MSEKLNRLAEAQEVLDKTKAEVAAVRSLQHHAGFGNVATVRREQGLTGPYDKATPISAVERSVLISALCDYQKVAESAVVSAVADLEGMLK